MKNRKTSTVKRVFAFAIAAALVLGSMVPAFADASDTYVSLGADLTAEQRATVLQYFGLTEADLSEIEVSVITNTDEHHYLDDYLPASVIGTKALSCVRVDKTDNRGIRVTTHNISYCTEGMYQNALTTAGIENADVTVAAPFSISGTAGLVGAMQAYQGVTGKKINEENADAAIQELVTTGELGETLGNENAENVIAIVKQKVAESKGASDEEILQMIDEGCAEIGVTLTDAEKQQVLALMKKISKLDLDTDKLIEQAGNIYDRLKDLGVDVSDLDKDSLLSGLAKIFNGIINFFKGLFS
ncbi:MAG: DUF1002 domain-containing protein [Firmicutes bacterium]|nr:DUF1002 domain-containing protein [Bacillota bacterium]